MMTENRLDLIHFRCRSCISGSSNRAVTRDSKIGIDAGIKMYNSNKTIIVSKIFFNILKKLDLANQITYLLNLRS